MKTGLKVAIGVVVGAAAGWFGAKYYYQTKFDKIIAFEVEKQTEALEKQIEKLKMEKPESKEEVEPEEEETEADRAEREYTEEMAHDPYYSHYTENMEKKTRLEQMVEADKVIARYNRLIRECGYGGFDDEEVITIDNGDDEVLYGIKGDKGCLYDPAILTDVDAYLIDPEEAGDNDYGVDNLTWFENGYLCDDDFLDSPYNFLDTVNIMGEKLATDFPNHFGDYPKTPRLIAIRNEDLRRDIIILKDHNDWVADGMDED